MKIILWVVLLALATNAFCQEKATPLRSKEYYLEKSKNKRTTAWILLGAGTAAFIGGSIGFSQNFQLFSDNSAADGYALLALAGLVSDIVSIPFFISAGHYKRLAADLSMGHQPVHFFRQYRAVLKEFPALTVRVCF